MLRGIIHNISILAGCAVVLSCSTDTIEMPYSEYHLLLNTNVESMDSSETKADLLNSGSTIPGNKLKLYGWDGNSYWIKGVEATYSSGQWALPGSYSMSSSGSYNYLAYANLPASGASISTPTTKDGSITYTVSDITAAQNDVLLGKYSVSSPTSGDVDIAFSHPYASVKFKLGNLSGVTTVTAVSLDGVYSSGKTTYSQTSDADGNSVTKYTWTNLGNANATISSSGLSKKEGDVVASFVVIPQDLSSKNAVLTVTYDSGSTMTKLLSSGKWDAGYTTTYTLDKIGDVDISITGLTVKNTGVAKAYIRATITGAWYDSVGNVVSPWLISNGTFSGLPGSGWTRSGDYFYYSDGLASSASTSALYGSYTKPATPVTGAILKLDILVQAIPYTIDKTCQEAFAALL